MTQGYEKDGYIDPVELPLINTKCLQIGLGNIDKPKQTSNYSGQKCFGLGQSGTLFQSWIAYETPNHDSPTDVAFALDNARDDSLDVFDQRDRELAELLSENVGNVDSLQVSPDGGELKKLDGNYTVYAPQNNIDDIEFQHSPDIILSISADPLASESLDIFDHPSGGNKIQDEMIELLEQIYDENVAANNSGDLETTLATAQTIINNASALLSRIDNQGRSLTDSDLEAIKNAIGNDGYLTGGSTVAVIGGGSGGSGNDGDGGQLPSDPAPEAGDGIGNKTDGELYEPAEFFGDEVDCESIECVVAGYIPQFESKNFVTFINTLVPPDVGSTLPVVSLNIIGKPFTFDFNQISPVFDLAKAMILIFAAYVAVKIVVVREAK